MHDLTSIGNNSVFLGEEMALMPLFMNKKQKYTPPTEDSMLKVEGDKPCKVTTMYQNEPVKRIKI